ncbi:MAG: ATP-binding cassette domain-containing protein [Firmicutes bacterium]|nr:ATP-binding cassette domain-containing protein [Bacillota bacterium]
MSPTSPSYAVETVELTKSYGSHKAVDGLNLQVPTGSVYGLLGPNGAGKTTTLKLITGLLRPGQGAVQLFGKPWQRAALARVGALIETPALYPNLTGAENLEVHRRLLGLPRQRIDEVLGQVGLQDAAGKRAGAYSLGMKQRLGIAIALLGSPELLILDEPTNGLDPIGIQEMRELIRSFHAQGITLIVSSHILAEVQQVVTHIGIIAGGRLHYQGPWGGDDLEEFFMKTVAPGAGVPAQPGGQGRDGQ